MNSQELEPSLAAHEAIIEESLNGFRKAAASLKSIKDGKLYKGTYKTYEEYCIQRWQITPQHANRLIRAADVVETIKSEPNGSVLPETEAQARALSKVKTQYLSETWKRIQNETGKAQPTAEDIRIYLEGERNEEVIDTEVIGSPAKIDFDTILSEPYIMGSVQKESGRAQISVDADDASVERLTRLKALAGEKYGNPISKGSVVSQALKLLELVCLQDDVDKQVLS